MFLKSLEIQGFKSFPDKTVLKFDRGMTAVVGPNGSGKSNISDAVKWVLGEQSTKTLRSSKMEDVIFSGTGARKALGFAEVTLRLDNTDRYFDRDEDEISVTRRYFRSGDSEYLINGQLARLRDVNELFMDTGLGRDGYSMVGQGRIEELVSNKSSERRDIFEEAAGISHFRYKRNDSLKRLNAAEDNLVRLRDILNELECRVEPLRIQSEKAKKYVVLADERKNLEIGLWLHTLEQSSDKIKEQSNKLEIASIQYEQVTNALDIIFSEIENARELAAGITAEIEDIRTQNGELEEQASTLDSQVAVCENSTEHNNVAIARAEADMLAEEETNKYFSERLEKDKLEIASLNERIAILRDSLAKKTEQLESISMSEEDFEQKITGIETEINARDDELTKHELIKSSAESAIEEISSRIESLDEGAGDRLKEIEEFKGKKSDSEGKIKALTDEIGELENVLDGYRLRVQNRNAKVEEYKKECDSKSIEIERMQSRMRMLEEMERNMEGYTGSVKAVMKEYKNGGLKGIHGTLSQLISTDSEYSIAIETALGAAIQNIVTDNESDAKKAMYFLRDRNLGRATFLPLSAIKGRELDEKGLDDCFGFVGVASELLEYDKKYEDVIISLLGRTVVVDDIDCAVNIAKKYSHKFKLVTLDGQVINAGGSMTGGSQIKNSGFLSRSGEIDKLRSDIKSSEEKLKSMNDELKRLREDYGKCKAEADGTEAELFAKKEEKIRSESAYTIICGQLEGLINASKELDEEKNSSALRIEKLRANADYSIGQIAEIKAEIRRLEDERQSNLESRRNTRTGRDELNGEIASVNLDIVASLKDIENLNGDIASLENRRESHSGKTDMLKAEIEELNKSNQELQNQILETKNAAAEIRKSVTANNDKISQLATKREEYEKKSVDLRLSEKEQNETKEKLASELVRLDERKTALVKEQEETEKKLFEEYQLTRREASELGIVIDDIPESEKRLRELRAKIRALGSVNVAAIDEYKEVSERYEFLSTQIGDIEKSKAELEKMIDELTSKMATQFSEKFEQINTYFKETFSELFGGGEAGLILEDPEDVLECGIEIKAQPPGKNVKSISLLSGGEKGLTAISLLFAILKLNPAPFCFFDEVEAALDDVNVSKYARYVRSFTDKTQFILITHRRGSMEEADTMYGVTMQEEGVSKLLKLETSEIAKEWGLE